MFMSCNHSKQLAAEWAAKQRAKEMATKGKSKISVGASAKKKLPKAVPKTAKNDAKNDDDSCSMTTSSASKLSFLERRENVKNEAFDLIDEAIKQQKNEMAKTKTMIKQAGELAKARLEVSHNKKGAALAMKKVKTLQPELIHYRKLIAGLRALKVNLESGLVKVESIKRDIEEIVAVDHKPKLRKYTDEELLQELEAGDLTEVSALSLEETRNDPVIGSIVKT